MNEIFAVIVITVLAVVSPGADFAMVTRNSYLHGRLSGLMSAVGISLGVQVHVMYTIFGVGLLITHSPLLFTIMKFIGAGYLVYIGVSTILKPSTGFTRVQDNADLNYWQSFKMGLYTNALNPKTMMFVISVFTQFVSADTSFTVIFGYGVFMSLAHLIWFFIVAMFFSTIRLREFLLQRQKVANSVIGGTLMCLGISLAIVPLV